MSEYVVKHARIFFRQKQRSEKWGRLYCVDSVDKGDNALYQLHTENICVDKR